MSTPKEIDLVFTRWTFSQTAIAWPQEEEVGHPPFCFKCCVIFHKTLFASDFCIKLWNLDSLLNKPEYAKEALLATIVSHEMSVNVVRWSKDGKFLASGSDDKSIAIHKYTPNAISNQTYGGPSRAAKNKETWSRCGDVST